MSEVLIERLRKSIGKTVKIFLQNGFRYEGELTGIDDDYVEILDIRSNSFKVILLSDVNDVEVRKNGILE